MDKKINKRPPVPENCPAQMAAMMHDCIMADPAERPSFEELDKRLRRIDPKEALPLRDSSTKQVSLYDIFPKKVAEALKYGRNIEPEHRDVVTIFFSGKSCEEDYSAENLIALPDKSIWLLHRHCGLYQPVVYSRPDKGCQHVGPPVPCL